jgi:hypothetical protein
MKGGELRAYVDGELRAYVDSNLHAAGEPVTVYGEALGKGKACTRRLTDGSNGNVTGV